MGMSPDLAREIFWIQLVHLLALAAVVRTNLSFFSRAGKDATLYRYLQLQICLALWIIAKLMKTISPTESLRWAWIVVQYAGVSALGPSFFHFAYHYAKRRPPRYVWILYVLGSAFFVLIATNTRHHLFYKTYNFYRDSFGPLFYVQSAYTYGLVAAGVVIAAHGFRKGRSVRVADAIIAVSATLPLAVNIMYILDFIQPLFDITPMLMSLPLALFAFAAFKHGFLGVLPYTSKSLVLKLPDPVVVRTPTGKISYSTLPMNGDGEYVLYRSIRKQGYTIGLYADFRRIRLLEREYDTKNSTLLALNERLRERNNKRNALHEIEAANRMRMDLHDVLGHSVTLIILLLKAATSSLECDPKKSRTLVIQARDQAKASARGLERAIRPHNVKETEGQAPYEYLSRMLDGIVGQYQDTDLSVEFSMHGKEKAVTTSLARALERCCQESFANAIKHSSAKSIFIGAIFRPGSVLLSIIDDGNGTDKFLPGHGIAMMRDRIAAHGGLLRVYTARGEGFQLSVSVPA
ncbi:hypothetical protein MASR2M48_18630 [Spirochaetota bacterium]